MKIIGYIHRYSTTEGLGILVYGHGMFGQHDYIPPILFDNSQCKGPIKSGQLVYFDIEDDGSINNIDAASIYNFDREIVLSCISGYGSKDWLECEKDTRICYQNISELTEWVSEELEKATTDIEKQGNDEDKLESLLDEDEILELADDFDLIDDFLEDDSFENGHLKGHYQKIIIPESIREEYKLFGRAFTKSMWDIFDDTENLNHSIIIDILDPSLWIPTKLNGKKTYYGRNANEFNDLIDLIFIKRRSAYGRYLDQLRYGRNDGLWKLNITFQKQLHPELFLNDCISNKWYLLLERLSDDDLMAVYQHCKLLQPILPKEFCYNHISSLDEEYGFPDVSIAEVFLRFKIHRVYTATEYNHYKKLLHAAKNCGVKHLPEEGTPFCAIEKTKLKNISISLGRKKKNILSFIEKQIRNGNPNIELVNITGIIDVHDVELMLKVGEFYDLITEISNEPYLIWFKYDEILKAYDKLPKEIDVLLDSYLQKELNKILLNALNSEEFSAFSLHHILEKLSKWIDDSFVSANENLIKTSFIKKEDVSDLINALGYGYISNDDFHERYVVLSNNRADRECLNDLHDCWNYHLPEQTQLYILERILNNYGLEFSFSYGNKNYEFPSCFSVHSLNDFLSWIKDNTVKYGHECISVEVALKIQEKVTSTLSYEQNWFLFEKDIISVLRPDCIKIRLKEAYSELRFEDKCFEKDCFQSQMADDVINFDDVRLIKATIDKLNFKYRILICDKIKGFGELYIWALNPTHTIDWENINDYFVELDGESQKRVFRFLFLHQSMYKDCPNISFLNLLSNIIEGSITKLGHQEKTDIDDFFEQFSPNDNTLSALAAITYILQQKLDNPSSSIDWNNLWASIQRINQYPTIFLRHIKDFFNECNGWLLLSNNNCNSEYYSRNGYVQRVQSNDSNESYYIVRFYETPLDINGHPVDYLDYSDIEKGENVLKRNFTYQYIDGAYLINQKDEIRLKEFITTYEIDDNCNLFDDIFGHNENQGYGIPEHLNYPTKYEDNDLLICNCSQFCNVDPKNGVPYRWCKKHPCTRKFFLQADQDWEKYKFIDLLRVLLNDTLNLSQIWDINSEIASFINNIAENYKNKDMQLSSSPLSYNDEVGVWTSDMCIYTDKSCDYSDEFDDDYDEDKDSDYNAGSSNEDTYERYNGSWAQDVEGYSDDDIDTIFDGDPDAYWNID